MEQRTYTYLAMGDSYTIGEGVALTESFPYRVIQRLRCLGKVVAAPEIIARTGWTTDELAMAMEGMRFLGRYDMVSLMIGVNNQYRGRPVNSYLTDFQDLLNTATRLRGRTVVLSIPDWSVTPFALSKFSGPNRHMLGQIAAEIDAYNEAARNVCDSNGVKFIDITPDSRLAGGAPDACTADGLHPAAVQLDSWAASLAAAFLSFID